MLNAFLLTLFAGLSTSIGALLAFVKTKDESRFLSFGLGFSGGVMVFLSFVEILPKSMEYFTLAQSAPESSAKYYAILCFFAGMAAIYFIDFFIPKEVNPHELKSQSEVYCELADRSRHIRAMRYTAAFTALAITIHNFPEGFATFMAALNNLHFGVSIAIAVALHNIPEGLAVALPIYYVTQNKKKAFFMASTSGLSEPLGAALGYFILAPLLGGLTLAISFGVIAGIMVFISLDSLLPNSKIYGKNHDSVVGMLAGMGLMALSLFLLG